MTGRDWCEGSNEGLENEKKGRKEREEEREKKKRTENKQSLTVFT